MARLPRPTLRPPCPHPACLVGGRVIKRGYFRTKSGAHRQRFCCRACGSHFSEYSVTPLRGLRKLHLTMRVVSLRSRNMSIRDAARQLGVSPGFVERRIPRLGELARTELEKLRTAYVRRHGPLTEVQLDEMETYEHTRLKPLSVSISVTPRRFIVAVAVAPIPAKGPLAAMSRAKYGNRPDGSREAFERVARTAARMARRDVTLVTDRKRLYAVALRRVMPGARHTAVKSRSSAVAGTADMKDRGFDRMFALNQTCAMVRSQLSRLNRRTWKGTKVAARAMDDLCVYAWWHNMRIMGGSDVTRRRLAPRAEAL